MSKLEIEPHYQKRGKELVDMMFDNKMTHPDFSRDGLQALEDYVAYVFQSGAEAAAKTALIVERLKKK